MHCIQISNPARWSHMMHALSIVTVKTIKYDFWLAWANMLVYVRSFSTFCPDDVPRLSRTKVSRRWCEKERLCACVCHKACEYDLALRTSCTHSAMQSTHSWCSTASKGVQTTSETHPEEKWSQLMRKYNQKGLRIARLRGLASVARSREEDFFFCFLQGQNVLVWSDFEITL